MYTLCCLKQNDSIFSQQSVTEKGVLNLLHCQKSSNSHSPESQCNWPHRFREPPGSYTQRESLADRVLLPSTTPLIPGSEHAWASSMHPVGNRVHHDLLEGRGHGHGAGVMREREENPSSLRDLCRAASVEKVWGLRKRLGFADFRKGGRESSIPLQTRLLQWDTSCQTLELPFAVLGSGRQHHHA